MHYDFFHAPISLKKTTAEEKNLQTRMEALYRELLLDAPIADAGLGEAAGMLAASLVRSPARQLSQQRVQAALWLVGRSDHQLQLFAMAFRDQESLWKQLSAEIKKNLAPQHFNRVGVGIRRQKQHAICVILFSRRGVDVEPAARWMSFGGEYLLRAKVLQGYQVQSVLVGLPDGKTQLLPSERKGDLLLVRFKPPKQGSYQIQVIVKDRFGAWISAQWHWSVLAAGGEKEALWRAAWERALAQLWQKPEAASSRPVWKSTDRFAKELWRLLNDLREEKELIRLRRHPRLDRLAQQHARDMVDAGYFGHKSPKYGDFYKRFRRLGWPTHNARENIVVASSPQRALALWLESPVHRQNLLNEDFIWTGIGVIRATSGRFYCVQVFVSAR
jgi:hypothetical protein